MILLCRNLFNDLCAWRGQFGGTLSGFEFFADGLNGGTQVFLKRRGKAVDGRERQEQAQRWLIQTNRSWGGADSSSIQSSLHLHRLSTGGAALQPACSTDSLERDGQGQVLHLMGV